MKLTFKYPDVDDINMIPNCKGCRFHKPKSIYTKLDKNNLEKKILILSSSPCKSCKRNPIAKLKDNYQSNIPIEIETPLIPYPK